MNHKTQQDIEGIAEDEGIAGGPLGGAKGKEGILMMNLPMMDPPMMEPEPEPEAGVGIRSKHVGPFSLSVIEKKLSLDTNLTEDERRHLEGLKKGILEKKLELEEKMGASASKEDDLTNQGEEAAFASRFREVVDSGRYEVGDRELYETIAREALSKMIGYRPTASKDVKMPYTDEVLYRDHDNIEWHRHIVRHPVTDVLYIRHERTDRHDANILNNVYYMNERTKHIVDVGGDLFNELEVAHQINILGDGSDMSGGGRRRSVRRSKRRRSVRRSKRRRSVRRSKRRRSIRRSKRRRSVRRSKRRRSVRRSKRRIRKNEKDLRGGSSLTAEAIDRAAAAAARRREMPPMKKAERQEAIIKQKEIEKLRIYQSQDYDTLKGIATSLGISQEIIKKTGISKSHITNLNSVSPRDKLIALILEEERKNHIDEDYDDEDTNKDWERKALKVAGGVVGTAGSALIGATGFTPKPSFVGGVIGASVPIVGYGIKKGVDYGMDRRKKNKENAESDHQALSRYTWLKVALDRAQHGLNISETNEDKQIMTGLYEELQNMENLSLDQIDDILNRIDEQIKRIEEKKDLPSLPPPLPKAGTMGGSGSDPMSPVVTPPTKPTLDERKRAIEEYAKDTQGKPEEEKKVIKDIIDALPQIKTKEEMDELEAKLVTVQVGE